MKKHFHIIGVAVIALTFATPALANSSINVQASNANDFIHVSKIKGSKRSGYVHVNFYLGYGSANQCHIAKQVGKANLLITNKSYTQLGLDKNMGEMVGLAFTCAKEEYQALGILHVKTKEVTYTLFTDTSSYVRSEPAVSIIDFGS